MLAVIPFFELRVYDLDVLGTPLPLDPWAILVCLGFVVGLEIARARAIKLGLDVRDIVDGAVFTVLMGFVVAHLVTVVFYFPERMKLPECLAGDAAACGEGVMSLLRVWEGFSSTGGFVGAVLGAWLFYTKIRPLPALRHADVITFGFPFGWFLGRLGCASVHDHVGRETTFPLAMHFDWGFKDFRWYDGDPAPWASGIRHELGLYEALYMMPVMALFLWWGKVDRPAGFFLAWFAILYAPARFVLDFLRNDDLSHQDARYLGLTPAQYGMVAMVLAGAWMLRAVQRGSAASGPSSEPAPEAS